MLLFTMIAITLAYKTHGIVSDRLLVLSTMTEDHSNHQISNATIKIIIIIL